MTPSIDVIQADVRRISAVAADQLAPAARDALHVVPLRSRVLEIGCGAGSLSRELAIRRGARVTAIDVSPREIDLARLGTSDRLGIDYRVADFLSLAPRGFDVAIAVDTMRDLPLAVAAERMADAIVCGGLIVIVDGFAARGVSALPYKALAWLTRARRASDRATMSISEIKRTLRSTLPGVAIRCHLGGQYTANWRKP